MNRRQYDGKQAQVQRCCRAPGGNNGSGSTSVFGPAIIFEGKEEAVCSQVASAAQRRLGRGNGTNQPGAVALAIDPGRLAGLAAQIPRGSVLVTGSNGKGTTCRMLAEVMLAAGLHPMLNHEGSNQLPGLTATLLARSRLSGQLPRDERAIGLFEVDEGFLPAILPQIARPRAVMITNIFRDQLDRYQEPDLVTGMLERVLRKLPAETTLVLNADDPRLAYLAAELKNPRLYSGIADTRPAGLVPTPAPILLAARDAAANSATGASSTLS